MLKEYCNLINETIIAESDEKEQSLWKISGIDVFVVCCEH